MSLGNCTCPDCGTTLRIRDRSFVGRQLPCPECSVLLLIDLDPEENVSARKPPLGKPVKSARAAAVDQSAVVIDESHASTSSDRLRRALGSPLVMAWALGLAVTALVVVAMLRPAIRFSSSRGTGRSAPASDDTNNRDVATMGSDTTQQPSPEPMLPAAAPGSDTADAMTPANAPESFAQRQNPTQHADVGPEVKPIEAIATKPPDPVPSAPPPSIDFDTVLKQPLVLFDQSKPVSRRELIALLEELLGAPIRYDDDELGEQGLNRQVTFKAENTTLGGILQSVLEPAGWMFVAEETELRVKLKPSK